MLYFFPLDFLFFGTTILTDSYFDLLETKCNVIFLLITCLFTGTNEV